MILCGLCDQWQHGACFGMTQQSHVPELHVCDVRVTKVNILKGYSLFRGRMQSGSILYLLEATPTRGYNYWA